MKRNISGFLLCMAALFGIAAMGGSGCDDPKALPGTATNCTQINTPLGCPTVYRVTDPDTGAILYIASSGTMTLLPKSEVQAEKK